MARLKTLFKRRDKLMDQIFDLAESNYDEQQSNLAARDSDASPSKASKERSKKLAILRKKEEALDAEIKNQTRDRNTGETKTKRIKTRTMSGGAGGRMMMPQEYSKRTLYKPKTN